MIKKILKYLALTIAGLLVVVLVSALSYRKFLQYRAARQRPATPSAGIDSLEAVRIEGIEQWIYA